MLRIIRFNYLFTPKNALGLFILPLLILIFVDALMSFVFPINIEGTLKTNTILGIIMAASSVTGVICDLAFPVFFNGSSWKLKYVLAICISMLFPLFNVLGIEYASVFYFTMASIIWGIYYELMTFSIHEFVSLDNTRNLNREWGILNSLTQFSRILGPIVGSLFLTLNPLFMLIIIAPILLICLVIFFVSLPFLPDQKIKPVSTLKHSIELFQELKYWGKLSKTIYSVFLLGFTIVLVDSAYWTIGGLLSKDIFSGSRGLDWVIIVLYSVALIIGASIASKFKASDNQYRIVAVTIFCSGLILSLSFFLNKYLALVSLFISSIFLGASFTFNDACSTNLIKKMGRDNRYLIGFIRLQSSMAYIIGPLILGFLSDRFNYLTAFSIIGFISLSIGMFLYLKLKSFPNLPH